MRFFTLFIFMFLFSLQNFAQVATLSGFIRDESSGEAMIGATIYIDELKTGAVSNNYGFYSITLPADTYTVVFSYLGYAKKTNKIFLTKNIQYDVEMSDADNVLNDAVISDLRDDDNVNKPEMSVVELPVQQIKEIPAMFGEKDLLKAIQLLPGVQAGSEASAGYYVRGGGPDQNLILMDEAVVYNPYHLSGFLSIFNLDAIKNVTLYKGGFPAQYGGRLSSILDISMKDGNNKSFHGEGGIGLITSRFTFEGPIIKDRSSFMVSGRAFYLEYLIRAMTPKQIRDDLPKYTFYDLNAKVNYRIGKRDRIYLSGYLGDDIISINVSADSTSFEIPWGNRTATARWNHVFNDRLFANTTYVFNDYLFKFSQTMNTSSFELTSGIQDHNVKLDFDFYPSPKHTLKFGGNYTYHTFIPSAFKADVGDVTITNTQKREVHEMAACFNDEWIMNKKTSVSLGVRVPLFIYKETKYFGVEPRLTAKHLVGEQSSIKYGYTLVNQFIHLLTNSTATTPLDLWIPSSDVVKPQIAHQVSAGYFRNFIANAYEASVEVYYKLMKNQIEYKEGESVFLNDNVDDILAFGTGWSYGAEFFLQKKTGRLNGWIGYTLAWTRRKFPELNFGETYPAKYDRRHDLSVVANYEINDRWSMSAVFVFGTGHSITLPQGRYYAPIYGWVDTYGDWWASDYESKNSFKLRSTNRLDLGIKYAITTGKFKTDLRFDIYNVYSRRNPYFVYLTEDVDPRSGITKFVAKQVSLFPMLPSLSFDFKF